jgi:glutamate N-acetyltransferase/amino-acid N-acetyltransferase
MKRIKGSITTVKGISAAGICCGIKSRKKDLSLISSNKPATAAAVFTRNSVAAAPIKLSRKHIKNETHRAILVNSGNANACTGVAGDEAALRMARAVADGLNIDPQSVLVASTGIIGVELPVEKIESSASDLIAKLSPDGGHDAAEAILTTDTKTKELVFALKIDQKTITIAGMAKGAGMIAPNMATMLCFIATDAKLDKQTLAVCLKKSVKKSFHKISVDGCMSTNDMVAILATGASGVAIDNASREDTFQNALDALTLELAKKIVRDAEGATKFVEIEVKGAPTPDMATERARAVADSNLVKTALFGNDLNWGRIMAALGSLEAPLDQNKIDLNIQGLEVVKGGRKSSEDNIDRAAERLMEKDIKIEINLNSGNGEATFYTSDLSAEYLRINSAYKS